MTNNLPKDGLTRSQSESSSSSREEDPPGACSRTKQRSRLNTIYAFSILKREKENTHLYGLCVSSLAIIDELCGDYRAWRTVLLETIVASERLVLSRGPPSLNDDVATTNDIQGPGTKGPRITPLHST